MENVPTFQYLGRPLDQTDDDWPDVRQKNMRARSVWGGLGTLIRREGGYPRVAEMFYRAVVQAILLYGLETWLLLAASERNIEGSHTGSPRHIAGKRERQISDGIWK